MQGKCTALLTCVDAFRCCSLNISDAYYIIFTFVRKKEKKIKDVEELKSMWVVSFYNIHTFCC